MELMRSAHLPKLYNYLKSSKRFFHLAYHLLPSISPFPECLQTGLPACSTQPVCQLQHGSPGPFKTSVCQSLVSSSPPKTKTRTPFDLDSPREPIAASSLASCNQLLTFRFPAACKKYTAMAKQCNMGTLPFPQISVLRNESAKASQRLLVSPSGSSIFSGLRGLPASRREFKSKRPRNLTIVATAAPLSRQFTSVPGFTQIGEPIPEGLLLSDVVKTLPKEVFEIDDLKAWKTVAITLGSVALGYAALAVSPWYLYPFVYAYLGTAMTGLFVVGHDCGHNSFSKNQRVNDVVGTVMFMPLMYPFEPWRIKHNTHHAHTNKLVIDTAWQPFRPYMYDRATGFPKFAMEAAMGPLWWMASVGHWLFWHFDLSKYRPQDVKKVKVSFAAVTAFGVFALLPLLVMTGPVGFLKWWVVPWLGFHFWMSTFTLVHHTAPHIPFKQAREWNAVDAQLHGTVHCDYPAWIDYLCHDISVHIPHHISSRIPSYNLRQAYASLQQNWDKHLNKAEFGVPLMTSIVTQCNLYDDKKKRWVKFDKAARGQLSSSSSSSVESDK